MNTGTEPQYPMNNQRKQEIKKIVLRMAPTLSNDLNGMAILAKALVTNH
jgi:hypothetical protein